jgi:DNA polymerase-3 subunit delta
MTAIKAQELAAFERKPNAAIRAVLFYGPDEGNVRERAKRLVKAIAGSSDDPFNVIRLEDRELSEDPGRLADEARSLSLMGGPRAIWIQDAGTGFLKTSESWLAEDVPGNLIVAEAGNLDKKSKLRALFEGARNAFIVACYADNERDLHGVIEEMLRASQLAIDEDARHALVSMIGSDRLASRGEIEKLALYCMGRERVTKADVLAVCGDAAALSLDETIDLIFGGEIAKADVAVERLMAAGTSGTSILSAAARHVARLQKLRLEHDSGKSAEAAVRSARPPVFFGRLQATIRQVEAWETADLAEAGAGLQNAQRNTREFPLLEEPVTSRALLALARRGLSLRQKRF